MLRFFRQNPLRSLNLFHLKKFSTNDLTYLRNIGISAHIDSGKTTFTERVLYYGGRIDDIHEVKGSDNVGAKMDFMELEREKGITIQSAATHMKWKNYNINIIDTPGHVDFTIEVERALRVLDGAVLIVCGVAGVQPQTLTVDKQMKRYKIPRIIFVNKLDRMGANPWHALQGVRKRLGLNSAAIQIPIGIDNSFTGVVDLIEMKGEQIKEVDIPENLIELAKEKRAELIETIANIDHEVEELYLNEKPVDKKVLKEAIRRQTLALKFCPLMMGSAYKNKGVQSALDGVCDFLPNPLEKENFGFRKSTEGEESVVFDQKDPKKSFVGFAFKLEENKFGQLTFVRVYQGKVKKGDYIFNVSTQKRMKISRMVKMHANEMEDINVVEAGDIFAIFGLECATGDTFTAGDMSEPGLNCSSIFVPAPVMSLSIKPKKKTDGSKFQKALAKFKREDPTFHVNVDNESEEIIISGMGELHLQIYAERIKREFDIDVVLGQPTVNYRETIGKKASFDYLHKKQSGGAGQYARVIGHIEPLNPDLKDPNDFSNQFENKIIGTSIPNEYITAVEKGFYDCLEKGPQTGYGVVNVKYVLADGATHVVDSSANAFMIATKYSFQQAFFKADPQILEPVMNLEVSVPQSSYSAVMAGISKRRGLITNTETRGDLFVLDADVPLAMMFGYATEIRGLTSGQGEFTMEYKTHEIVPPNEVQAIMEKYQKKLKDKEE